MSDESIVTYCRLGERAAHSWIILKYLLGYSHVASYDGSWEEWGTAHGVPIKTSGMPGSTDTNKENEKSEKKSKGWAAVFGARNRILSRIEGGSCAKSYAIQFPADSPSIRLVARDHLLLHGLSGWLKLWP